MKTRKLLMGIIVLLGLALNTKAQTFSCTDFMILALETDAENPDYLNLSLAFNAAEGTFANYPYVSALLDCNGDTVATGGMMFFGQFAPSTVPYSVLLSGSTDCLPLTAVFHFTYDSGEQETCTLQFGITGIEPAENTPSKLLIYPNPAQNEIVLNTSSDYVGDVYLIYDSWGRVLSSGQLNTENTNVNLTSLPAGLYFIRLAEQQNDVIRLVKQ